MANAWIIRPLPFTALAAATLGAAENLSNDYTGIIWQSEFSATIDYIADLGADMPIDSIALFGVDLAPGSATIQVFASTAADGDSFSPPTWSGATLPLYAGPEPHLSGKGVAVWSAPSGFPAVVRYVLLRFGNVDPFAICAARLVIGTRMMLERNFNGITRGVRDLGALDFSARGVLLRRRAAKLRTIALTFSNVTRQELETVTLPLMERIGNTEMIAVVSDPDVGGYYFGPHVGDLNAAWRKADRWEAKLNLVSIF